MSLLFSLSCSAVLRTIGTTTPAMTLPNFSFPGQAVVRHAVTSPMRLFNLLGLASALRAMTISRITHSISTSTLSRSSGCGLIWTPSSFQRAPFGGPFFALIQHHPRRGADFIIWLLNHSTEWYAHHRDPRGIVEPPWQIEVWLPGGASVTQWCNQRLWQLYRGTSVGPYVLQCALMALERWLLELCVSHPEVAERWLLHILRTSTSGATTAVVASVATAYPHVAGDAAVALIACRAFITLDHIRMRQEVQAPSGLLAAMPTARAADTLYTNERKEADALPHRRSDLESVAMNLQLGPHADRVREILDSHRRNMPPLDEQTEDDRLWRRAPPHGPAQVHTGGSRTGSAAKQ